MRWESAISGGLETSVRAEVCSAGSTGQSFGRAATPSFRSVIQAALDCKEPTVGATHNYYLYPARFSPVVARTVISRLTNVGELVFDPFMGGGTSIVEALRQGRRAVGSDLNSLAHFVSDIRTRYLSLPDQELVRGWARLVRLAVPRLEPASIELEHIPNLPRAVEMFMAGALSLAKDFKPSPQAFARCALLRLGQWALDCRDFEAPRRKRLGQKLPALVEEMLKGMSEFQTDCASAGVGQRDIAARRVLLHRSAVAVDEDPRISQLGRPKLVLTSPPYPCVNVLYHRWQYRGRRETPAPYWIAGVLDGEGQSFYTGGSRTPTGEKNYFGMIEGAFRSVRKIVAEDGHVVQLVGFSDVETQLPTYLETMKKVGFSEKLFNGARLERVVPNRKWYARNKGGGEASTEFLLIHRPSN